MNRWVMAFPFLMYLGSVGTYLGSTQTAVMFKANVDNIATGILTIFYTIVEERDLSNAQSTLPYLAISLSLNIILTLMIVVRLFLLDRSVRATTQSPGGISGLYKTISTMLIESSALFAVSSLLVIVPLAAGNLVAKTFYAILAQTQVCPPSQFRGWLSDVMTDWSGHRPTAHHTTSRQQERVGGQRHRLRNPRSDGN